MNFWQYVAPSSIAGSNPATFPIALSGKKPGFYELYMYAAYGNEGTSSSSGTGIGNSPEISAVTAYPFYLSPVATATVVQADMNPQQLNQRVTLTAIVTPAATGAVDTPTGTVNFYDGTTLLNTAPVSIARVNGSEEASFQTSFSTTGAHSITAVFTTGDMNYFGSTSGKLTENIASAPTVTGIAPISGPTAGGTVVTITGSNFTGATSVSFGGVPATSFTVISATSITATSPAGAGTVDVVVTNSSASSATSSADTFTYTVPTITVSPTTLPNGMVGAAYTQAITASGGTAAYTFSVTAGTLPMGLAFSSAGVLSGTPTAGGTFNFTVTATDTNHFTGDHSYLLMVNAPTLTLSPASLPLATGETAYSQTFVASGGTAPYTYLVSAGALPAGLTLNTATGVLSGTPTAAGPFNFAVITTDSSTGAGAPYSTTRAYTLTVNAPTITVTPATLPGATVGFAYPGVTFGATGGTAAYVYAISAGALPAGLTLSSAGALSGTPTAGGTFNLTVTATDKDGFAANQSYTLIVNVPALTLSPVSGTKLTATAEAAFSQTFAAGGGTAPYTYIEVGSLASGITFNPATATLSGTPTQTGSFPITISARDSSQGSGPYTVIGNYTLTVNAPTITLTPATLPAATVSIVYAGVTFGATGGTASYAYSVSAGALPLGLTLSSAGVLSGTPTAGGTFSFTVTATDKDGFTANQAYSLIVNAPLLILSPSSLPTSIAEAAYSQVFTTSGGTAPYIFAVSAGALPAGLSLNASTGVLSGTPTVAGSFNFTVRATDSSTGAGAPFSTTRAYTLTVTAPAIVISPATLPNTAFGVAYNQTLNASGGTGTYTYSITTGALPAGVTLSGVGVISGTSATSGNFSFTVTAKDGDGFTGAQTYSLTVIAPTVTVSPATLPAATVGLAYSATLTATGSTPPYTFSAMSSPAGLTLSGTGLLSGTPTTGGTFSIAVTATDSSGSPGPYKGMATYSLTIGPGTATLSFATVPAQTYGNPPFLVSASSVSAGAITYSVVSGPATVVAGSGLVTLSGAGTVILQASQVATASYNSAMAQMTLNVAKQASVVSVSATPAVATPVQPVTLTATVSATVAGTSATPMGAVVFLDNGVPLGTLVNVVNGVAQLVVPSLPAGTTAVITATYQGDTNFLSNMSSNPATVVVAPLDFTFTNTGTSAYTAAPGAVATYSFGLAPLYSSYPAPVSFSVTGLPIGATASFTPTTVAVSAGATSVGMTVQTPAAHARNDHGGSPFERGSVLALLLLPFVARRSMREKLKSRMLLLVLLTAGLTATLTGCGSINGFLLQSPQTYTLTVTATGGTLTHSQIVTLIVQ